MAVRNFWIELEVDGGKTRVATGPRGKNGGFTLTVYIRDAGESKEALEVTGKASSDGVLQVTARKVLDYWGTDDSDISLQAHRDKKLEEGT